MSLMKSLSLSRSHSLDLIIILSLLSINEFCSMRNFVLASEFSLQTKDCSAGVLIATALDGSQVLLAA